jgi:hypothetical protein
MQEQISPDLLSQLADLEKKALDEFSRLTIAGARCALVDLENPLRLNFFSTAIRILFEHMMGTLAPIDQVKRSGWFVAQRSDGIPTRWQRVVFAIQGGLTDKFVKDELSVDVEPLRKRLLTAMDDLSKYVHAREATIVSELSAQDAAARLTIEAVSNFLQTYHDCRLAILSPIQQALDNAAIEALLEETIQDIDELASHYSLDEIYVDQTSVKGVGSQQITYEAEGTVDVTLQWGSNSDVRNGDGAELSENFPFKCQIDVPVDDIWNISGAATTYFIDTKSWRDVRGPDDCKGVR